MEVALWAVVMALGVGFAILAYEFWGLPRRRHRVLLNFREAHQPAIEGVLWGRRGRWLIMRDCYLIETAKQSPTRIDGETMIDADRILFLQIPQRH